MSRHDQDQDNDRDDRRGRDDREDREDRDDRDRRRDDRESEPDEHGRRLHRERGVVLFADQSGSIIRAGDEALEEDLPVLNAFRQFLDAERKRARRQLMTMIGVFVAILAALAGGGYWYVRTTLHKVQAGLESEKVRFEEDRLATVSNLQNVAKAAVSLRKDMLENKSASSAIQDRVKEQTSELSRLLDTITSLEIQNATLQRSMKMLDQKVGEPASESPEPEPARAPAVKPLPPLPPMLAAPAPAPTAEPAPAGSGHPFNRKAEPIWSLDAPPKPAPVAPAPRPTGPKELPAAAESPLPAPPAPGTEFTPGGVPFRLPVPKD